MQNPFIAALKDFLSWKFLGLTLLPFLVTFLIFGAVWDLSDIQISLGSLTGVEWLDSALNWLLNFFVDVLGWVVIAALSTVTATMVIGFFTPYIVKEIHRRHYPHIEIEGGIGIFEYIWLLLRSLLKFLGVALLSLIFYFIPLLNYIAFHIPFYYLFSTLMTLDVGGEIYRAKELEEVIRKHRGKIYTTTLILYLITLIPFTGMLLQVYFVGVMAHLFFQLKGQ
ncbi:MAG: EI24 domain-containing protein [Epsilonproteobacteria bacterium]|nr:hypothetical protein [Campylobacterota bacterium]NPA56594.1 EI24 domain-containing protein [Campylobacterota bacterium]